MFWYPLHRSNNGRRGRDRMIVGITTTYAISAYHHKTCEFECRSCHCVLDTTLCDEVCQWLAEGRSGFLRVLRFPLPLNWPPRYNWNIVESDVLHHKPPPDLINCNYSWTINKDTIKRLICVNKNQMEDIHFFWFYAKKYIHVLIEHTRVYFERPVTYTLPSRVSGFTLKDQWYILPRHVFHPRVFLLSTRGHACPEIVSPHV